MKVILYNQEFENHLTQLDDFQKISIENKNNPFLTMSNFKDCNELHLLAHGSPGNLDLGTGIDTNSLYENAEYLSSLNVQKIILWGCHVGKDNEFIKTFSNLTNSIIYSSKDYLGKNKGISNEFPSMNNFIKSLPFYLTFGVKATIETQKLNASDANTYDYFGFSVSISGATAIVGAYGDNDPDIGYGSGSAYIFHREGTTWNQQQKLIASDANVDDRFGISVSISGATAIVGAYWNDDNGPHSNSGSAYIFERNGTTWNQQQKLTASDDEANDYFGYSVSISGETAIVGSPANDDVGPNSNSGSAYIFERDGTIQNQQQKLTATDASSQSFFGYSVSISGETAIVGTPYSNDVGSDSGSAYIFEREGTTWSQQSKLTASDADSGDQFGWSVSISGDHAIVGAYEPNDSGSAYIFKRVGTTWTQQETKIIARYAAENDNFGISVSISGETAIVGAYEPNDSGSAYIFSQLEPEPDTCPYDINGDGKVDVTDLLGLIGAWGMCS